MLNRLMLNTIVKAIPVEGPPFDFKGGYFATQLADGTVEYPP